MGPLNREGQLPAHAESAEAAQGAAAAQTQTSRATSTHFIQIEVYQTMLTNIPEVKLGIIAVSRDCFIISLSERRRAAVCAECAARGIDIYECKTTVENERDMLRAVDEVKSAGCNALVVFLGNFGPETPETLIARHFDGPVMHAAAAEESGGDLIDGRGDAYCGMLNCSYNLGMRHLRAWIPAYPVGTAADVARMIAEFRPIARALIGLSRLKIITFGPRPQDFFACNAPIKGLYELGVEVEENSELDLLVAYRAHAGDSRIPGVCADMAREMGEGRYYPDLSERLAQFELTLLDWAEQHRGSREYVAFADKCWPAFPEEFGFEPCYVNSRLASRGIPVSCEVDIYGALSEYIGMCVSEDTVTLLDINNSVPADLYRSEIAGRFPYELSDTFMGFHCGNTPSCKLCAERAVKYQLIQHRLLEPAGSEPDFTRGTLEGDIAPGEITFYRLQCDSEGVLRAYIAEGEVLPVATRSFGGIGVFAISEMGRFYRHVLLEKRYPHHGAVAFGHHGRALFEVMRLLGVRDIAYNQPKGLPYPTENPSNGRKKEPPPAEPGAAVHLPTQNLSNMRSTTSSRTVRPVSSPRAWRASSASVSTASGVRPLSAASSAARSASAARRTASAWRALVSISPAGAAGSGKSLATSRASESSPSRVRALSSTTASKPRGSSSGDSRRGRSHLFITATAWRARLAAAQVSPSASASGCEPSYTARAKSALSAASSARRTPRRSASPSALRSPAVSVSLTSTPPSRAFSSIVSRVVPGLAVTMARS